MYKTNQKFYRFLLVIVALFTIGCADDTSSESSYIEVTSTPTAETSGEKQTSVSDIYRVLANALEESLHDQNPSISFDSENNMMNIVLIAPPGTAAALQQNPDGIRTDWDNYTEALLGITKAGYQAFADEGHHIAVTVMVLNDSDPELALFAAMNGKIISNTLTQ